MSWASSEVIRVLVFLLPGFVAAAIFHSLTSHPKPGALDRIIQALIFTVIGQAATAGFFLYVSLTPERAQWTKYYEFVSSVLVAIILGLVAAVVSNTDILHRLLRYFEVTKETSYPSEWYSSFARNDDCYVVLHLNGERRLYGWPEEWPSRPEEGHFRIAEGEWLVDDKRVPATGVSTILIPAGEVEMVEFMRMESESEP